MEHQNKKNPKKCGNSVSIDGIYICKLELLPCMRVKQCPESVDFAELFKNLFSDDYKDTRNE